MGTIAGALVIAGGLAACGGGRGSDNAAQNTAGNDKIPCPHGELAKVTKPVNISYWHGLTAANKDELDTLTKPFNGSQNKVRVSCVAQPTYAEVREKYLTALRGGSLP